MACHELYPDAWDESTVDFTLQKALRALGLPCTAPRDDGANHLDAHEAARAFEAAVTRESAERIILCPLDLADRLPDLDFGPCSVRRFSKKELETLFHADLLRRTFPGRAIDLEGLAEFNWLCIKQLVKLGQPGRRAAPFMYDFVVDEVGAIEPHASSLPTVVEEALFLLLLEPWEEWTESQGWTAFQIPWTYASTDDIFSHRVFPRGPETLSWHPQAFQDHDGEWIEEDVPIRIPLDDAANSAAGRVNSAAWDALQRAMSSPLFETPIMHFLVRGWSADGIDEFIAHMLTIEAALGVKNDYGSGAVRPDIRGGKVRMQCRISALLDSVAEGDVYGQLFELRSEFLHGRKMGAILALDRQSARSLARKVARAVMRHAVSGRISKTGRDDFVNGLLVQGAKLRGKLKP